MKLYRAGSGQHRRHRRLDHHRRAAGGDRRARRRPPNSRCAGQSTTPTAGAADNLTITAQDTYGNTATAYTGSHSLIFSGASASPGGNPDGHRLEPATDVAFGTRDPDRLQRRRRRATAGDDNGEMKLYKSGSTSVKATEGTITTPTAVTRDGRRRAPRRSSSSPPRPRRRSRRPATT